MAATILQGCFVGGEAKATGSFDKIGPTMSGEVATESQTTYRVRVAGTFSNFGVNINSTGTGRVFKFRKNTGDGNQSVSVSDGASGWFVDSSNSDTVSVGDDVDISITETGTNPTVWSYKNIFTASSGHVTLFGSVGSGANSFTGTSTTTFYHPIVGQSTGTATTTVGNVELKARVAGTLQGYFVNSDSNTRTSDTTAGIRKNGAAGNNIVTITASTTGTFVDTSHSDTIANDDLIASYATTVAGSGAINYGILGCYVTSTSGTSSDTGGTSSTRTASATTHYIPLMGRLTTMNETTEANVSVASTFAGTASNLRFNASTNTYTGDATVTFRKNTGNGNQTFTITATTTGWFEDASNSDSFTSTDLICASISGGTANSLVGLLAVTLATSVTGAALKRIYSMQGLANLRRDPMSGM